MRVRHLRRNCRPNHHIRHSRNLATQLRLRGRLHHQNLLLRQLFSLKFRVNFGRLMWKFNALLLHRPDLTFWAKTRQNTKTLELCLQIIYHIRHILTTIFWKIQSWMIKIQKDRLESILKSKFKSNLKLYKKTTRLRNSSCDSLQFPYIPKNV